MTIGEQLLDTYLASLSPAARKASYRTHAVLLCKVLEGREPSREAVDAWLEGMKREKYQPGTIRFAFGVARRLFKVNGLEWPYQRYEMPVVQEREEYRPSFNEDLIGDMILSTARLQAKHRAYLALATTYGIRRVEIQEIAAQSFNWSENILYIATAKSGRQRYHVIPDEILEHLRVFPWPRVGSSTLSGVFADIKMAAGISKEAGTEAGWHGIRRSLTTALTSTEMAEDLGDRMSSIEVQTFMRWKRSSTDMTKRYSASVVIGREGPQVEMGEADEELDRKAFNLIPWLPIWKEVEASGK